MIKKFLLGFTLLTISSCSIFGGPRASLNLNSSELIAQNKNIGSGSITIVKQVPPVSDILANLDQQIFALKNHRGSAVIIDRIAGTIELQKDHKTVHKIQNVSNLGRLDGGKYNIMDKQRQPLWYAPDEYFTKRHLPVPSANTDERLLRGALGDYALILSNDTALHNSPLWTSEVGGVKLEEQELTKLYYQLDIGTPVIVN